MKTKGNNSAIIGLDSLPNKMDLTQLFDVKGGRDIDVCFGSESVASKCKGDESKGVTCSSAAVIVCSKGVSAVSCSGSAPAISINPPEPNPCTGKPGGALAG